MSQVFRTCQFMAGRSPAVRIPVHMAFAHQTELLVIREGNRIIIEPQTQSLEDVPGLLAKIGKEHSRKRPEFVETDRHTGQAPQK